MLTKKIYEGDNMSDNNNIKGIIDVTMEKMRTLVDADVIIGKPIVCGNFTMIPVSKVAFGMGTGGSDLPSKNQSPVFAGGGGAGVNITPVAFVVVNGDNIKMMPISSEITAVERAIAQAPETIEKLIELFSRDKKD